MGRIHHKEQGFTLIEIMLVLTIMGLVAGFVAFNSFSVSPADKLEEQARRLQVAMDMASDFAVLNQRQFGLRIDDEDQTYVFMVLDENDEWMEYEGQPPFQTHTLPEPFTLSFNLTDLPWETEDSLFDRSAFDETLSVSEDEVEIGEEEEEKPEPPQILILSSGEVTPFAINFEYEAEFSGDPTYFVLENRDMPPVTLIGPLDQLEN